MTRGTAQSGFTLLEVLLALAMVSMLAMALYSSLRIGFRARDSANAALRPVRAAHTAMDLIGQDLLNALPPGDALRGTLRGPFIGQPNAAGGNVTADDLQFCCMIPAVSNVSDDPTDYGGVGRIELAVETIGDDETPSLVRRVTRNLLSQQEPDPDEEVLCRNVKSFVLRYYDGTTWQDSWDSTTLENSLPVAVEATLEIQSSSKDTDQSPGYTVTRIFPLICQSAASGTGASTGGGQSSNTGGGQ